MGEKQRGVLIAVMIVIVGMLLFPPFHYNLPKGRSINMGYGWLFSPPSPGYYDGTATVNIGMLLTQWVGVLAVGAIAWFLFRENR